MQKITENEKNMKIITWNVNGIRACLKKGFMDYFSEINADMFCIQETKLQDGQLELKTPGYKQFWNYADKKGYSGTAIFTKTDPISSIYSNEGEGRVIALEYENFYLVNAYVPNSQRELTRLNFRINWEIKQLEFLLSLQKPVIYCGDLNVAHNEIDLKNPKTNIGNAGFTYEERQKFSELLNAGFVDVFRHLYPEKQEYSWWSYMRESRAKNIGWRIDYFVVSEILQEKLVDCQIHSDIFGSDHCPILLEIN
jgi:exodeoxyribonuclease-3